MRILLTIALGAALCLSTTAAVAADLELLAPPERGRFWDRQQIVATSVSFSLASLDAAQTCAALNRGRHELTLPTQSCGPAVGWILGGQIGQNFLAYELRKRGHTRLGRAVPWLSASGSAFAVTYSFTH